MTDRLTIRRPDDWHVHLRDGDMLAAVAPLGVWLGEAPPFRATRVASALARVAGVGALAGAAVWAAASHGAQGSDAYAAHGDSNAKQVVANLAR